MGLMRFLVHDRHSLPDEALAQVYATGQEELPWRTRAYWQAGLLIIEREENDSGCVHVPWPCQAAGGELILSTACLMQRERPYQLEIELARGTVNTLRNQIAAWSQIGLIIPASINGQLIEIGQRLARAATSQHEPAQAVPLAKQVIEQAVEVSRQLGIAYTQQALGVRRQHQPKLTTLMAVNLGPQQVPEALAPSIISTFNTAVVPIGWRQLEQREGQRDWTLTDQQIEWCQRSGLRICGGPLLQLHPADMPDWTYLWEGEFDNLLTFMLEHVRAVVNRYRGKVHLWQVAGRVNGGRLLGLNEEQRLRIVVGAIEAVRAIDTRTPLVVTFDQPWGEYLARQDLDLAPIHFADTLARSDLGLSGLGLEINTGYWPGTLPHSMLDYSRQIDRWSTLGLPLMVSLTTPSSAAEAPQATSSKPVEVCGLEMSRSPQAQAAWLHDIVPLLLAKTSVQVICWNQLRDAVPHELPHSGLFDLDDHPKPALDTLREIRCNYLT